MCVRACRLQILQGPLPFSGIFFSKFKLHVKSVVKKKKKESVLQKFTLALFSKNVHDESLPTSIQTMSCKLLLNLVECIKDRSHKENALQQGRELLMRMNEVFVQKFKTVAKLQLPVLVAKFKQQQTPSPTGTCTQSKCVNFMIFLSLRFYVKST